MKDPAKNPYYNPKTNELNDKKVVKDIRHAADLYEDGQILEAMDIMIYITQAIHDFSDNN